MTQIKVSIPVQLLLLTLWFQCYIYCVL